MEVTTLCYIEKDNKYLMLNRTKKKNDINEGKWIGVGGHIEEGESPYDCIKREIYEETGLSVSELKLRGHLTFILNNSFTEYIWLYTATDYEGELKECDEGILKWIDKDKVYDLNLWEGDKVFLKYLEEKSEFFSLKLEYKDDKLVRVTLEDC
jgi:8-oxo-dGTP diphosphatase